MDLKTPSTKNWAVSITLCLLVFTFILTSNQVNASEASGWAATKVEYVDNNLPAYCNSDQASVEFLLVEENSQNLISNSIGNWTVNIRNNKTDTNIINTANYNGQKQSERICFEPTVNGLQVLIHNSSNYKPFLSPTVYPEDESLDSMRGNHFRAYVHLKPESSTPSFESVSPKAESFNTSPTFTIATNELPDSAGNPYSVSELKLIKLYLVNQTTDSLYTNEVDVSGGAGIRNIPGPSSLPDGRYLWTFHQEFDGFVETKKLVDPPKVWEFTDLPVSAVPDLESLTVDTTPPASTIKNFAIKTTSSSSNTVTLEFDRELSDALVGIDSSVLNIEDSTGSLLISNTTSFPANVTASTTSFAIGSLPKGETYTFYTFDTDNLGNSATSTPVDFHVPIDYNPPEVELYNGYGAWGPGYRHVYHHTARILGTTTDAHSNPLPVTDYGGCWSTDPNDLDVTGVPPDQIYDTLNTNANCLSDSVYLGYNSMFSFSLSGLPASSTVKFILLAENDAGWGASTIGSFVTDESPYDDTYHASTTPTVEYIPTYSYRTHQRKIEPNLKITDAGYLAIDEYGVCFSTSKSDIETLDPVLLMNDSLYYTAWENRCNLYGPLSVEEILPYQPDYYARKSFTWEDNGIVPDTEYHIKAFAVNAKGAGAATGTDATLPVEYKFRNYIGFTFNSPVISTSTSVFDESTATYDNVIVEIAAIDNSFDYKDCGSIGCRSVDYKVTLEPGDGSPTETRTGVIETAWQGGHPPEIKSFEFNDLPVDVPIKITSGINVLPTFSPQNDTYRQVRETIIELKDPDSAVDTASGDSGGSGSDLSVDPETIIYPEQSLIRRNQSTVLNWSAKNVDIECAITGPSTFDDYNFNPSIDGDYSTSTGRSSGSVNTPVLENTQIFKVECSDSYVTYSTTTRVSTLGETGEF